MSTTGWRERFVRRLWRRRSWKARAARTVLLPFAAVYTAIMGLRSAWYGLGLGKARPLPLPAIAVGNLSVGGTGKTPLASWIAGFCVAQGRRPGVLLRGYGRDEVLVHRRLVPDAIVVANPDRMAGAKTAKAQGASVLVLDDAFQLLDTGRDVNIAVLAAEQAHLPQWTLPAGPWREGLAALSRADLIVITRKRAALDMALGLADRLAVRWPRTPVAIARFELTGLAGMNSGVPVPLTALRGQRVLAAAGIADPESFAVQVRASGATVQLAAYQDHHEYGATDVARLVQGAAGAGYLVITEKDAVKLRSVWPAGSPEPLVAVMAWTWERNELAVVHAIQRVLAGSARATTNLSTHHS